LLERTAHRHRTRSRPVEDEEEIVSTARARRIDHVHDSRAIEVKLVVALRDHHASIGDEVTRSTRVETRLDHGGPKQHDRHPEHEQRGQRERHDQRDETERRRGNPRFEHTMSRAE
jgi:hypothetical protein